MKITIKSLKQIPYEIDVPSNEITIKNLKQEIEITHGFDAQFIKVLFKGSMLDDNKTLKDYNITEGDNLTMMNSKVKPQNVNININNPSIQEESKEKDENKVKNKDTKDKELKSVKNTQNFINGIISSMQNSSNDQKPQKDYSNQIKQLIEIGFVEIESTRAINAANGNLERAVEYLYNGIPEHGNQGGFGGLGIPMYEDFLDPNEEGEEDEGGEFNNEIPLTFEIDPKMLDQLDLKSPNALKTIASFVKVLISEDPSNLQSLLEDIEETNPEIIEFIKEHEEEFKQLISAPLEDKDLEGFLPISNNPNLNLAGLISGNNLGEEGNNDDEQSESHHHLDVQQGMVGDGNLLVTNTETIKQNLTQIEKESIERLKVLGFSEEEVLQAFIACDKNEIMSANFLLENKFKDPNSMDVDDDSSYSHSHLSKK